MIKCETTETLKGTEMHDVVILRVDVSLCFKKLFP